MIRAESSPASGPRPARRRLGRPAGLVLAGLAALVSACGGPTTLSAAQLGLPSSGHPRTLASATYDTSPDGGIYVNPDPIHVTLVGRIPMEPLAQRIGAEKQWAALQGLGQLTAVAFQLTNSGLAGSSPQLDSLQIASSSWATCQAGSASALCPEGVSRSTFDRFYYPAYPLAGLSTVSIDGSCSVSIDPGQTATVVLIYPPIRSTTYVTWGEYGTFAVALPLGGAITGTASLRANICVPPDTTQGT
ncbi:MAG: hypothetical protein ACLQT7_11275 [Candidatus Dormibacteria bacterium]